MTELERFAQQVTGVTEPEDLFGELPGVTPQERLEQASVLYKRFARIAHEDLYQAPAEKTLAHEAFTKLTALWSRCQAKLSTLTYGQRTIGTVASRTETYLLQRVVATGDLSTVYQAMGPSGPPVLLKVALSAACNELLDREVSALAEFRKHAIPSVRGLLPDVKAAFLVKQPGGARAVTVFAYDPAFLPLTFYRPQFPDGLDPRHGVWIFKRLLSILASAHDAGIIHGAVLPQHVLLRPKDHALMLVDWCFSVPDGNPLSVIAAASKSWYPPEVFAKQPLTPRTDLLMAAQVLAYAMGGTGLGEVLPERLPDRLRRVVRPCLFPSLSYRPQSAWAVYDAFDQAALRVFGKPQFVQFEAAQGV